MYDYISIRSDAEHSKKVSVEKFVALIESKFSLTKESSASFRFNLGDFRFVVQGILANSKGCYSFKSDSEFKEINLVEISIPQGSEGEYEHEILDISLKIASLLGWEVHDNETGNILHERNNS